MSVKDIITIIFSSTLITTVITTIFNLFTNKKKDAIENITKERKTWRDELRQISLRIYESKSSKELKTAINQLKVRINAYGIATNSIFDDTHIWEDIHKLESTNNMTPKDFEDTKKKFVNLISCSLKYDWERSKAEIKGNGCTRVEIISLAVSFILYSAKHFFDFNAKTVVLTDYYLFCTAFSLLVAYTMAVIYYADVWRERYQLIIYIVLTIVFGLVVMGLILTTTPITIKDFNNDNFFNSIYDLIIVFAPIITLIYATEIKLLTYKRNAREYILSVTISSGRKEINKKYKVFFGRKEYQNYVTGETISFQ